MDYEDTFARALPLHAETVAEHITDAIDSVAEARDLLADLTAALDHKLDGVTSAPEGYALSHEAAWAGIYSRAADLGLAIHTLLQDARRA